MQPLRAEGIRGNWATLLSCWNADESLDLGRLAAQIDALIGFRPDGIYSHGTAGEFHTQTEAEFDAVATLLAERCNAAAIPFQIGVSHPIAQVALERLRRIAALAPGAVQLVLPDWFPVTDDEAGAFLERMAEHASGIGLVLYNPPHAKRVLGPAEMALLAARCEALIGWKTAGGDDAWFESVRAHDLHRRLSVFVPGHLLASGVRRGAHGAYSNVACLHPGAAQAWSDGMATDLDGALEVEGRLRQFMAQAIAPFITRDRYCNAACDRLLAAVGGWGAAFGGVGESMRWPYRSIPGSEIARVRAAARALVPEFIA
ncbi:MAG: dihydrodipicolinate synthase family protein [Planctomycetes bacterium]|nr:dihydrodipicolinate synthase family protein [Planctomycetota bacterium]